MSITQAAGTPTASRLNSPQAVARRSRQRLRERVIETILLFCGAASVAITIAIVAVLLLESAHFFGHVSIVEFVTGTVWTPLFADARYGILPLVTGTLLSSAVALAVAFPLGM